MDQLVVEARSLVCVVVLALPAMQLDSMSFSDLSRRIARLGYQCEEELAVVIAVEHSLVLGPYPVLEPAAVHSMPGLQLDQAEIRQRRWMCYGRVDRHSEG